VRTAPVPSSHRCPVHPPLLASAPRYVLKWNTHYDPARDEAHRKAQFTAARKSLERDWGGMAVTIE
jgi:hypothetical protein